MSDLKPCPVCKGQSGGIGSDGVENDCMACFAREVQAASPRVEACIASCLARYHGESKAAQARYFEEVHQRLAPLARSLEIELAEAKAELARRTQPEATAPAQDLSAAILAIECIPCVTWPHNEMVTYRKGHRHALKAAAALASSANALSAGDRVDAERYRWLRNESWAGYNASKHKPEVFETVTMVRGSAGNFKTILAEEALDAAVDAAILQSQKDGHD